MTCVIHLIELRKLLTTWGHYKSYLSGQGYFVSPMLESICCTKKMVIFFSQILLVKHPLSYPQTFFSFNTKKKIIFSSSYIFEIKFTFGWIWLTGFVLSGTPGEGSWMWLHSFDMAVEHSVTFAMTLTLKMGLNMLSIRLFGEDPETMQSISRTEIVNDINLLWCLCIIQKKPGTGSTEQRLQQCNYPIQLYWNGRWSQD